MAGEIVIPLNIYVHRDVNANGVCTRVPVTATAHRPRGWRCPTDVAVDYLAEIASPIPSDINGTPAGKIRLWWVTADSDTTSATKFFVKVKSIAVNTGSHSISAWDDELEATDTSNGADILNEVDVSIVTATLTVGREIVVLLRRDKPGTGADALNATTYLRKAFLVADQA